MVFQIVILPLLIFLARILDVTLDTLRILFVSRGRRNIAPLLGFLQVMVWLLAIRQIFLNLSSPFCFIAYALGFAVGTWIGMLIEEKLAIGVQVVRMITRDEASQLIGFLRKKNCRVTAVKGQGATGEVSIIYTVVKRQDAEKVIRIVRRFNPKAFYTIEDIRAITEAFPHRSGRFIRPKNRP